MKKTTCKLIFPKNKKVQKKANHEILHINQVLLKLKKLKILEER